FAQVIAAISRQKNANRHLVSLVLQMVKKTANPCESSGSSPQNIQLLPAHLVNRKILRQRGSFLRLDIHPPIFAVVPWSDRKFFQRKGWIRNDLLLIQVHNVPKTLTPRARAKRTVKREHARIRFLIKDAAIATFKPIAEIKCFVGSLYNRVAVAFPERRFQSVRDSLPVSLKTDAIHQNIELGWILANRLLFIKVIDIQNFIFRYHLIKALLF